MSTSIVSYKLQDGINRAVVGKDMPFPTPWALRNMRHSASQFGVLEQTPYWYLLRTVGQGTYYNGGSQTEPTGSDVVLVSNGLSVTEYCIYNEGTQIQCFYQSTDSTQTGLTGGCRVVINSVSGLAITLGNSLEIDIDGATTFRWRKNGGAWTSLVPITTTGVSIDGGNATVYFLTATGFNVGDTWTFTRTDRSTDLTPAADAWLSPQIIYYKAEGYLVTLGGRVIICKKDASGTRYVMSAGYRPLYAQVLTIFQDHLVLGGYGTAAFTWETSPQNRTVAWSDVTDVENFIATDTNEADQYVIPARTKFDVYSGSNVGVFVNGLGVWGETLYVFTSFGAYQTQYLGLPAVFSFSKSIDIATAPSPGTYVAEGRNGLYIVTKDDFVIFDGATATSIGNKVVDYIKDFKITSRIKTHAVGVLYNHSTREAVFVMFNNWGLLTYQEKYGTWYYRPISDSQGLDGRPTAVGIWNAWEAEGTDQYLVGLSNRRIWIEDSDFSNQPQFDATAGTAYVTPFVIYQPICGNLSEVKEMIGVYIAASLTNNSRATTSPSSTYYSTGSNIRVKLSWVSCPNGFIEATGTDDTTFETRADAFWDTTKVDGFISMRTSYRGLALKVELIGAVTGKPPGFAQILSVEPTIYANPKVTR